LKWYLPRGEFNRLFPGTASGAEQLAAVSPGGVNGVEQVRAAAREDHLTPTGGLSLAGTFSLRLPTTEVVKLQWVTANAEIFQEGPNEWPVFCDYYAGTRWYIRMEGTKVRRPATTKGTARASAPHLPFSHAG
jgi:hypothetical protein